MNLGDEPTPPEATGVQDSGMSFISPLSRGRPTGGRKSKAPGVERIIVIAAAVLIFAGAFLDDPAAGAPGIMMFLDKLVMLVIVITGAALFARRGPPGRWLGPVALLIIVGAWVAGGLLRDPVQKAGYFPMTTAAVAGELGGYMPDALAQAQAFKAAADAGRPVPAPRFSGRASDAGRYVDAALRGGHAVAVHLADFRRECGPYLALIDHAELLAKPGGLTRAHAALADCRASAERHRAGVLARMDALPADLAVFRNPGLNAYVKNGLGDTLRGIRPKIDRTWALQIAILDLSDKQLTLLEHTRWAPQFGAAAFYREEDRLAFHDLTAQISRLHTENVDILTSLAAQRQDMIFQAGIGY